MKSTSSKKELLARILCRARLPAMLRRFGKGQLVIFNYHRIYRDDESLDSVPFDSDVYSCSESQFAEQVDHLQDLGRILTFDEFQYWLDRGDGPGEYCSLLTFDDGYVDNFDIAFPILKSRDAAAGFFVPTETIQDRHLGWWDIVNHIVKGTQESRIRTTDAISVDLDLPKLGIEQTVKQILVQFKSAASVNVDEALDELSQACRVARPGADVQSRQLMTIENLIELRDGGMEIGGHGHSHRIFGQLKASEQEHEIACCTETLAAWMGNKIRAFAYPVGLDGTYSTMTKSLVRRYGYDFAFNYLEKAGAVRFDLKDRYDIDRLAVYRPSSEQFRLLAQGFSY